jgi:hypothetical protein
MLSMLPPFSELPHALYPHGNQVALSERNATSSLDRSSLPCWPTKCMTHPVGCPSLPCMQTAMSQSSKIALEDVQFLFFDISEALVQGWDHAFSQLVPEQVRTQIQTLTCALSKLPPEHAKFDCIVSPANSYGRLDGRYVYHQCN